MIRTAKSPTPGIALPSASRAAQRVAWLSMLAAACGCSRDWDSYDPRSSEPDAEPSCGGVTVLAESFESGFDEAAWQRGEGDGGTVTVREGHLVASLPESGYGHAFLATRHSYDLTGRAVSVEAVSMPPAGSGTETTFGVRSDFGHRIEFYLSGDQLRADRIVAGQEETIASVLYQPTAQRFWRVREQDGVVYWETSDGGEWQERASATTASLFDPHHLFVYFGSGGSGNGTPVETHFDDLNGGGPPAESLCPAHALRDDFDDREQGAAWRAGSYTEEGCSLAETDGRLVATMAPGAWRQCGYATSSVYNLLGSAVVLEVVEPPEAGTETNVSLQVAKDLYDDAATLNVNGENVHCQTYVGNQEDLVAYRQYVHADHRWLRLREESGALHYEASAEGASWLSLGEAASPFDLGRVKLIVGFSKGPNYPDRTTVAVDNLNLPP
ncbi:MAG: hypothetical protein JRI23_16645 [Deltaproteobacteria bacterium]|jgi:hypothetical protein|nr:hypothetical protein [Deltaproteobacteria bacterium]MBW2533405.1 hypothetical protein [Deltaproteobacteria bacterium]